jgi:hypothetical protein
MSRLSYSPSFSYPNDMNFFGWMRQIRYAVISYAMTENAHTIISVGFVYICVHLCTFVHICAVCTVKLQVQSVHSAVCTDKLQVQSVHGLRENGEWTFSCRYSEP